MGTLLERVIAALIPNYRLKELTSGPKEDLFSVLFFFFFSIISFVSDRTRATRSARSCFRRKSACSNVVFPTWLCRRIVFLFCRENVMRIVRNATRSASLSAERECHS
jgi:hypothetical protein